MLAPGGFDATMEKWTTAGVWKGMRPLETLSSEFTLIAYDRRESGASGGRVERLTWSLFADQAKALLDHLGIREAYILGGCMGCSVALAFASRYPQATRALVLHWPVGGYRWKLNGGDRFARHADFAREHGLAGVVMRAHEGKSFWQDPEAGPWASVIVRDARFAEAFPHQDPERYVGLVAASGRTLFDRDMPPGAEPEEMMAMKAPALILPGDDPAHAASGAYYLRELLPRPEFWPVMPPDQTPDRVRDRILEFGRTHK
jgi:pimeloyl-ACP methyl ester carboxylesterase